MSAAHWSERKLGKERATQALASLPESETGKGAAVPFPYADRETYEGGLNNRQLNRAIRKAPVVKIPLTGIYSIQHSVQPERVQQYIDEPDMMAPGTLNPKSKTPIDYPVVVEKEGEAGEVAEETDPRDE